MFFSSFKFSNLDYEQVKIPHGNEFRYEITEDIQTIMTNVTELPSTATHSSTH